MNDYHHKTQTIARPALVSACWLALAAIGGSCHLSGAPPAPVADSGVVIAPGLTAVVPAAVGAGLPLLEADLTAVITESYYGGAVQWDPHEWFDLDPARWQRLLQRVEFMRLGYIRCMLQTYWYCTGFRDGQPVYVWEGADGDGEPRRDAAGQPVDRNGLPIAENLRRMRKLYDILDFCQAQQVDVLCGEWGAPAMGGWTYGPAEHLKALGIAADDPRYAQIVGGLIRYLVVDRGYTCIKEFNLGNEVNLASAYDATWTQARWQTSIRHLHRELERLGLADRVRIVGPDAGYWQDLWYNETLTELAAEVGTYDFHWYVQDRQVRQRVLEHESRLLRNFAALRHPGRALIYGEIGLCDDLQGDQQWHVRDYGYGVSMAAALIQAMRAGLSAGVAWSLDDSIHLNGALPSDYQYRLTPAIVTKVWGLWNSLGTAAGRPEDEALRPWYTPWSLLSRCFPKGAQIVRTSGGAAAGLCAVAARIPVAAGGWQISFALVNDGDSPAAGVFAIPGLPPVPRLARYVYAEGERPADAAGFPVPAAWLSAVDLGAGLRITLPARSVQVYSSLDGGEPVAWTEPLPARLVDTMDGLTQVCARSENLGFNGFAEHPNRRDQQDLDIHPELFLGNCQRIHRSTADRSAFLTWKFPGVSHFRIGVYHRGEVVGRVRIMASADNATWQETAVSAAYVEPTAADWSFSLLVPSQEIAAGSHYLRVELLPVGAFGDTQLAYVELGAAELPELRVTAVEPVRRRQTTGFAPDLPETLVLTLNHVLPRRFPVRWDSAGRDWRQEGLIELTGSVAGNAVSARATVEMVSRLVDPMDSMDVVFSRTPNLGIDLANAAAVGDRARFMRTSVAAADVVYRFAGLRGFELDAFVYGAADIGTLVGIQASADGATWQSLETTATPVDGGQSGWRAYRTVNATPLPAGTSYLRLQLHSDPCTWIQQLGTITLSAQP